MDIKATVATNLSAWMASTPALSTLEKLEAKSGVGFGTIRRARKGEGNLTIENLAKIASAFGRTAAALVTPADASDTPPAELATYLLPPSSMQNGLKAAESSASYSWPFRLVSREAYEALPPEGQGYVQGCLQQALEHAATQFDTPSRKRSA